MKVNKTYEEMVEYLFNKYDTNDFSNIIVSLAKSRLLNNRCKHNVKLVKKLYQEKVLYEAGFEIKFKKHSIK